jgi:hypothetical protein
LKLNFKYAKKRGTDEERERGTDGTDGRKTGRARTTVATILLLLFYVPWQKAKKSTKDGRKQTPTTLKKSRFLFAYCFTKPLYSPNTETI